jgi:hypothetical protein
MTYGRPGHAELLVSHPERPGDNRAESNSRMTWRAWANSIPTLTARVQITTATMSALLALRMNRCTRLSLLTRISLK